MIYIYPFPAYLSFNDKLAHNMFFITLKTTTRVYVHSWGPKAICHDALDFGKWVNSAFWNPAVKFLSHQQVSDTSV